MRRRLTAATVASGSSSRKMKAMSRMSCAYGSGRMVVLRCSNSSNESEICVIAASTAPTRGPDA